MLEINSLDHNGNGIGNIDGKIVFVSGALEGEVVDINVINEKKNFIEAKVSNFIKTSKDRVKSPCPYFGICGGCDIMHMNYASQLKFKQNKMENIINKYLNEKVKINKIVESNNITNYRNKVTFQVNNKIGFYKNKSYELVKIDKCLISNNLINNSIKYLNMLDLSLVNKIICRTASDKLMVIVELKKYCKNFNVW